MLRLDRTKTPRPLFWETNAFRKFLDEWVYFHGVEGGMRRTQRRAPNRKQLEYHRDLAFSFLLEANHGKCVYSEQRVDRKSGVVTFHRPEADAIDLRSKVSPDHYWWGVCDWSNWVLASRSIQLAKGTSFPVATQRSPAPPETGIPSDAWLELNRDRGLLLDPYRDDPAWYLTYLDKGRVGSRKHPGLEAQAEAEGHDRGAITIKILDLNNKELVSSRGKVISYWGDRLQEVRERRAGRFFELLGQALDARLEFAGAIRQVAASQLFAWLEKANQQHWLTSRRFEEEKELVEVTRALSVELAVQIAKFSTVQQDLSLFPESCRGLVEEILERDAPHMLVSPDTAFEVTRGGAMAAYATQAESDLTSPSVIERSARINHIEIVNFKAIDSLKFDPSQDPVELLPRYGSSDERLDATAWTVLLGENGSGKSSIMQAIALALAGDQLDGLLDDAKLSWRKLLRRGQSEGRVLLGFSGGSRIELRFDAERHWWGSGSAPRMAAYVRGYGATRLLEGDEIPTEEHGHVRVANLLNPRAPVIDAERWLLDLEEEDFHTAARTITSFIGTDDPMATSEDTPAPLLSRNLARKEIELVDGAPLSYASDGYRAIIALICDVMAGLGEGMADMRNATGIVLIDEIGAHLHPRWKVQITSRLRREFPQLQFLVSTHEPLCLRGLFAEEVWYVAKESSGPDSSAVEVEQIERSPNDYRVDQLLTSEFFGLGTTIDPDIDRRFQVYYRLLAMKPEERAANGPSWTVGTWEDELERLHNELEDYSRPVLGYTRRDQLVYAAIDEFLKKEGQLPVKDRKKRRQKTLDKIQDIWRPPSFLKDLGDEKP